MAIERTPVPEWAHANEKADLRDGSPAGARLAAPPARGRSSWEPPDHPHWVETATGRCFDLLEPRPEDVALEDIAAQLSKVCRYTGACRYHYSVAEHSLAVELAYEQTWRTGTIENRLWCLLHDAAEAYMGDCTRPLRRLLGDAWDSIEHRVDAAVASRFGMFAQHVPQPVKDVDNRVLMMEARVLLPSGGRHWVEQDGGRLSTSDWVPELLSPDQAELRYRHRVLRLLHLRDLDGRWG